MRWRCRWGGVSDGETRADRLTVYPPTRLAVCFSDSCKKKWTEHLNPIVTKKKKPNLLMLQRIYDLSPPTSHPNAPPSMDDKKKKKKNPLFNQQ